MVHSFHRYRKLLLFFFLMVFSSCSFQKLAIRQMVPIIDREFEAVNEEPDLVIAEQSVPANLKLLEGLIKSDPKNQHLLVLLSQGYFGYALGFVEDINQERARDIYKRGRDYGIRALSRNPKFAQAWDKDLDSFSEALQPFGPRDVPAVFWTLANWAMYINFNRTDPNALVDFPKITVLANSVLKNDETFFYGGAHMILGTLLGSLPKLFGGNPQQAKEHFEKCFQINGGKFLLAQVYYAKSVAVMTQDQGLFESLLKKVLETPANAIPEQTLANTIAQKKAKALLEHVSDYF